MCYESWICILAGMGLLFVIGFLVGLYYAKYLMKQLIRDNIAMHKRANECEVQLNWLREVDKDNKGEYNRRLTDKILQS